MIYTALLRGINVGGKNRVEMSRLKNAFENAGFKNVKTYINSGNVIFEAEDSTKLADKIEKLINKEFKITVPVLVRDLKSIQEIVDRVPSNWANNSEQKTDVMFLWDEANNPKIVSQFKINPDYESLIYVDGALVWNIDRKFINRGEMIKIVGTKLYSQITIRNINTVRKLHQLMSG